MAASLLEQLVLEYTRQAANFHQFVIDWGRPEGWPETPLAVSIMEI